MDRSLLLEMRRHERYLVLLPPEQLSPGERLLLCAALWRLVERTEQRLIQLIEAQRAARADA